MVDVSVNMANPTASRREFNKQRIHEGIPKVIRYKKYFLNKQQKLKLKMEEKRNRKKKRMHSGG